MDSEMSKMGNLTGWLLSKSRWTYFQQNLTVLPPSSSLLAIPIKKGENFEEEEGVALELEQAKNFF